MKKKYKIFKFCQGCIGKWQRVKGNTNYCIGCLNLIYKGDKKK